MPLRAAKVDIVSFGPFTLSVSERLLTKGSVSLQLSARALDILIALVSNSNQAVSKRDLMAHVWPDVTVGENSLRFHIANLRKALGDGRDGARYITTLSGRGYCFVAPVIRPSYGSQKQAVPTTVPPSTNIPARLTRMVGRTETVLALSKQLAASRFVTIVGPGGVGKTTVAVAVANDLLGCFAGAVQFVDLGVLSDPDLLASYLASILGVSVSTDDSVPGLMAYLHDKRMLLILDTCEHLVEPVAVLAGRIFAAAPQVHILATSREALRVEGEHVHKLPTLVCPPDGPEFTAAALQTFPATQLFMERVAASGTNLDLSDREAAIVVNICRKLDGVALAIELAAGRAGAYGLQQTAALLEQRLTGQWQGKRTAPPRQKTLQATLDWSYELLSELERAVLRRLAVFVGHFAIDAALAVVTSATVDQALVLSAIDSLVAKSMVATNQVGAMMRYRLLDTTRAYALEIGADEADLAALSARHADYYRRWLEQAGTAWLALPHSTDREPYFAGLNNARAALEWCFGPNGNAKIGVSLAAAAVPVLLAMSMLPECRRWSRRALLALDGATRGGREEMRLQGGLGMSSMFTEGNSEAARLALDRALAIAERLGDSLSHLQLLARLHIFHYRVGNFKTALRYAKRRSTAARRVDDPQAVALAHSLLGISLSYGGDLTGARRELEAALRDEPISQWTRTTYIGFDHYILAGAYLARTLWLQGYPVQALERARQTVEDAERMEHPVTRSIALIWMISALLWTGDLDGAGQRIERLISHARSHALSPYLTIAHGFKGALAICRGEARSGVESLQTCLEALHAASYELLTAEFHIYLVQGLVATGRFDDGMTLIDETIRLVKANGNVSYMPELLRAKGGLQLTWQQSGCEAAEICFRQSRRLSRRQGARAWELRTAIDLAMQLANRGQRQDADTLLRPVFEWFEEGRSTADLKAAEHLLASLR
jgi:predicted ATPase/DNA-binding winged helix-turn-helix (wHTH) protein